MPINNLAGGEYENILMSVMWILFCLVIYYLLGRKAIVLYSGRSEIYVNVTKLKYEIIENMIFEIENAKQKRLEQLRKRESAIRNERQEKIDTSDRLIKLKSLFEKGLLSKEEFEKKRSEIIKDI